MADMLNKHADASIEKIHLLNRSFIRYFILSMMAGIYVGFGVILAFSIGAPLNAAGVPFLKALMGASFGIALTLVIFAGSEIFTGNNMTMVIGVLAKKVTWADLLKVWVVSYIGNLTGSLLLAWTMAGSGLITGSLYDLIAVAAADKMNAPFWQLFIRGVLCNMLVCLAIWTTSKVKEDTAKLILIFWCLYGFIGSGFEHSVANMSLLGMSIFSHQHEQLELWRGFINNLVPVSLGNILGGGLFIGAAYWFVYSKRKEHLIKK